jgi:hypothetical protein
MTAGLGLIGGPALALAAALAAADEPCALAADLQARSSAACEALFGDADEREANRRRRAELLERVTTESFAWGIVHRGDWAEPEELRFDALTLVEASGGDDCVPVAVVALGPEERSGGCEAGRYAIETDDSLGSDARVLAIVDGVVLLEREGRLVFLRSEAAPEPVWRMIWHPTWKLHRPYSRVPPRPTRRR